MHPKLKIAFALAALLILVGGGAAIARFAETAKPYPLASGGNYGARVREISRDPRNAAADLGALASPRIVVRKRERKLLLYSGNKLVRSYRVGLGLSPVGDKVRQGDRRTPEGDFYIFTKNNKSAFYLSLGISYPNAAHAERGLRDGLITKTQYDSIMRALKSKQGPPQNTALGGDIYIHGNGASSDWTWGCVALENEDIRELFNAVPLGTPVIIKP